MGNNIPYQKQYDEANFIFQMGTAACHNLSHEVKFLAGGMKSIPGAFPLLHYTFEEVELLKRHF